MSEQQWYCPNCGPVSPNDTQTEEAESGLDYCNDCGYGVSKILPPFVLALQSTIAEQEERIATLEAACELMDEWLGGWVNPEIVQNAHLDSRLVKIILSLRAADYQIGEEG